MRDSAKIIFFVALITMAAQFPLGTSALADDHDRSWDGAPGPIAGAGLPILAVGYGVYWLIRRRRKAPQ
jgi:hypothetical protein